VVEAVVPHPPQCPWGERRGRRRRSRRAGRSPRSRSEHGTPPSAPRALDARGIPFQVRGGERFFQRVEVRAALRALRAAAASGPGTDLVADVHAVLGPQGLSAEPPGGNAARARWESLRALVELAEDLVATVSDADLPRFVTELETRAEAAHPPVVQGVTLSGGDPGHWRGEARPLRSRRAGVGSLCADPRMRTGAETCCAHSARGSSLLSAAGAGR